MIPRLTVNCATRLIALSWRAASPGAAHVCQYVVATISTASRRTEAVARRVICRFTSRPRVRAVGDEEQACEQDEVRDDARAAVADERQRDSRQRDHAQDAAEDDERLQRERERQPCGEQLREAVVGEQRD